MRYGEYDEYCWDDDDVFEEDPKDLEYGEHIEWDVPEGYSDGSRNFFLNFFIDSLKNPSHAKSMLKFCRELNALFKKYHEDLNMQDYLDVDEMRAVAEAMPIASMKYAKESMESAVKEVEKIFEMEKREKEIAQEKREEERKKREEEDKDVKIPF